MTFDLNIKFDPAEWKGFLESASKVGKVMSDAYVSSAARYMALASQEALKSLLSAKVAGITITASGKSANNIFVARGMGGGLHGDTYLVYEGPMTRGNFYIRSGSPPQTRPPIHEILTWMRNKGMANFTSGPVPGQPQLGPGPGTGSHSGRAAWMDTAYAIQGSIAKKGTSVAHKPLYPGNAKRYDYVTYAVRKLKMIDLLFRAFRNEGIPHIQNIMVGFWKTGRFNKNSVFQRVRPRKRVKL